jgi:hypothetical protein
VYRRDTDYDKDLIRRYMNGERFEGEGHYGMLWAESDEQYAAGVQRDEYISTGVKITSALASHISVYSNFEGMIADGISVPENYAALKDIVHKQGKAPEYDDGINTVTFNPDTDAVFAYECERLTRISEAISSGTLSSDKKKVLVYDGCSGGNAGIYICFLDGSHPTIRHYTGSLGYHAWLNARYVVYCGKDGRSPLQVFDTVSRETFIIEQEDDVSLNHRILSSNRGKLVYEVVAEPESGGGKYEQPYSFDKSGEIVLGKRRRLNR